MGGGENRHVCSVNLFFIFRIPFTKNPYGGLLLLLGGLAVISLNLVFFMKLLELEALVSDPYLTNFCHKNYLKII